MFRTGYFRTMKSNEKDKKMKHNKYISLHNVFIISILFLFCMPLAGCGSKTGEQGNTQTDTRQTVESGDLSLADFMKKDGTVDIPSLQNINAEAYAWLEITGTDISFPVLQPAEDEYFYLSHNIYGKEDEDGCIYTEYYNNKDFGDPNTIIYGRNREERFGRLHQYKDRDFFDSHREVKIYLEDRVLTYQIFAAYTYDDRHLIATYDFWDQAVYSAYLEDIFAIRAMDAFIDNSAPVSAEDKIITLSTGVTGEDDKRYLVQAVLVPEQA